MKNKSLLASDFLPVPLNPTHPSEIVSFLKSTAFKPSKHLGQNFLIDFNILTLIIESAGLKPDDIVLEVGTGFGALTIPMAERVLKVITVEKDKRIVDFLSKQFAGFKNIILLESDIMQLDISQLFSQYKINKVVSNFPYSIASVFLMELFKQGILLEKIVATLQREVALRILSEPNTSDYGLLAIWAQLDYEARKIKEISRNSFFPPTDVQSMVIELTPHFKREIENSEMRELLFRITKSAFNARRKQIKNNLSFIPQQLLYEAFRHTKIAPEARPESISVAKWIKFAQYLFPRLTDKPDLKEE